MGRRVKVLTVITVVAAISLWAVVAQAQNPPMTPQELARWARTLKAEPTLQEILNNLGYDYINVATDETGIELFEVIAGGYYQILYAEEAGWGPFTSSGWYPQGTPADTHIVFTGDNVPGDTAYFTIGGCDTFGLYLNPENQSYVWYTESGLNSDCWDHSWIFRTHDPRKFIVAWEDQPQSQSDADYQDLVVLLRQPNQPPVITCPETQTVDENSLLSFLVCATDADGDSVTLRAEDLPSGASFPSVTDSGSVCGTFSWTPDYCQAGVYTVRFIATDNYDGGKCTPPWLADTCQVVITVNDVNQRPEIVCLDTVEAYECSTLVFMVTGSDPDTCDNDLVLLTALNPPPGASFGDGTWANPDTGKFTWHPAYCAAPGPYTVTFIAEDNHYTGNTLADTCQVVIVVNDVDQPPMITATYTEYTIDICEEPCIPTDTITAFDPDTCDGDDVILTCLNLPEGATFTLAKSNPVEGYLDWCPTLDQADSTYVIYFKAQGVHSKDLYDTLTVTITVLTTEVALGGVPTVWPGADFCIPLSISSPVAVGGYNFLLHYDNSMLTLTDVIDKYDIDQDEEGDMEYFYWDEWQVDDGNKLRIIGIANKPNDPDTPPIPAGEDQEIIEICFQVSAKWDPNYWIPIDFEVDNACVDNTITDELGEDLYITGLVETWMFTPGEGWEMHQLWEGVDWDYCVTTYCDEVDTLFGCMVYTGTVVKSQHIYGPYGDVNGDHISYTIADAVFFMEYLKGVVTESDFPRDPSYHGTASDINLDGHQWTIADLIYLVNIVNGSAEEPGGGGAKAVAQGLNLTVKGNTVYVDNPIAGLYLIVEGGGEPELKASGMEMETGLVDGERRILIIGADWRNETATATGELVRIPGEFEVKEVQVSDAAGQLMVAKLELIPNRFALHQNYPNPFNPNTKISFDLPEDVDVSLVIYNTSGQKVAELVEGNAEAGYHTVSWNAADVASGVYFYTIVAGDFTVTRKMVLMK